MLHNALKQRLAADEVAISMQVRLVESVEIAHIAKAAGFDCFYIDLEHCAMSLRTVSQICVSAIAGGIAPMVRTGNLSHDNIGRLLDIGALGIIAPHIRTADDARHLVDACRFPPAGSRSVSIGLPHFLHRPVPALEARRLLDAATVVTVMIESLDALENVEAIAAVDGLDLMLVGTNDLTAEMDIGREFDHPRVEEAYERILAAGKSHGVHVGIGGLSGRPDLISKYVEDGARFISSGSDLQFLVSAATAKVEALRAGS